MTQSGNLIVDMIIKDQKKYIIINLMTCDSINETTCDLENSPEKQNIINQF